MLDTLKALVGRLVVPPPVCAELAEGRALGVSLPDPADLDWLEVRRPADQRSLALVMDLGAGEREVLALALKSHESVVLLDDAAARRLATCFGRLRGRSEFCSMPSAPA
jgi:predicted nucleic acid-binding protein